MKEFTGRYLLLCLLLFTFGLVIIPHGGHEWDMRCWARWAEYISGNGLGNVYESGSDYPPVVYYLLVAYNAFLGNPEKTYQRVYYLKYAALLFHFISGFVLALLIKKKGDSPERMIYLVLFYLLNIAVLYNTVIWGQFDVIQTCLVFTSCYFAYRQQVVPSLIFLVIAINFKIQAAIFFPAIGLMLLPVLSRSFSLKNFGTWIGVILSTQLLLLSPFIASGSLNRVWTITTESFGKYPFVSMNAFNVWDLILSGNLIEIPDRLIAHGLSYKNWGLLMFFTTSAVALFPLLRTVYNTIRQKSAVQVPLEMFLLTCGIIPLLFFYFNTQMHERYSHSACIFLVAHALYTKKPWMAVIGCLAYILNLELVLKFMGLENYDTWYFNRTFISILFLSTIMLALLTLYFPAKNKSRLQSFG
ncbi:MAG: hypothetical protein H6585_02695 [Flavobacteriales bacterium]|nr:hypothetical protein [Flavobacteriales bacterium]MCB9447237.1 hypothetical protein [Flavobacteriales bacterium]